VERPCLAVSPVEGIHGGHGARRRSEEARPS
jgi:hypothetical protein